MGNLNITDIAIFDWNAIMVFDYKGTNYDALNPTLAKGTWFKEQDAKPYFGQTFS